MPRSSFPQQGRPKGSTIHRIAMYCAGVAIGLILVGLLKQMRQVMVPPPEAPTQATGAESAPADPGVRPVD
ncbi:MAG: hypothetical protein ACF8LK_00600 [Phycisphaerales bacterium JB041]